MLIISSGRLQRDAAVPEMSVEVAEALLALQEVALYTHSFLNTFGASIFYCALHNLRVCQGLLQVDAMNLGGSYLVVGMLSLGVMRVSWMNLRPSEEWCQWLKSAKFCKSGEFEFALAEGKT